MRDEVIKDNIEVEIRRKIIEFYEQHKEECDEKYADAIDKTVLDIYEEIEDVHLRNFLLIQTEVVILTANVFEKNILHLNAVRGKQKKICHCIVNTCNNPRRPLDINVYFFKLGGFHILHMEANQTGSYSMGGVADLVRYVKDNDYCFPSAIVSYGICFGNNYLHQRLGDTIIVKKLYPYFMSAKIREKNFFVEDSNIFEIDTQLGTRIKYLIGRGELREIDRIFLEIWLQGRLLSVMH